MCWARISCVSPNTTNNHPQSEIFGNYFGVSGGLRMAFRCYGGVISHKIIVQKNIAKITTLNTREIFQKLCSISIGWWPTINSWNISSGGVLQKKDGSLPLHEVYNYNTLSTKIIELKVKLPVTSCVNPPKHRKILYVRYIMCYTLKICY